MMDKTLMDTSIEGNMDICDLHTHSIRSACGLHTLLEMAGIFRLRGQKAFAITDHGPLLGTPRSYFSILLRRLPSCVQGIRVFKGIEASILDPDGTIDLPFFEGYSFEIVLAGLHKHHYFETAHGRAENTRAIVSAMRRHPEIKIISHPYDTQFPVDPDAITDAACETATALEMNTTHIGLGKVDNDLLYRTIECAAEKNVMIAINSDGHVFHEMGVFDDTLSVLEQFGIDRLNIVNLTLESTLAFLGLTDETGCENADHIDNIFATR